jgi:hypothetical protein
MKKIKGRCLCGAIHYHSDAAPVATVLCNCKHCQRQAGSAFSVVVAVPRDTLVISGVQPKVYSDTADSGLWVKRKFCGDCGSPLFTEPEATPALDWIKVGTLDDTSWLQPEINIWCDSKQNWLTFDDRIPQFARNPPST